MPVYSFLSCYFFVFVIINSIILYNDLDYKKLACSRRVFLHILLTLLPQLTLIFILLGILLLNLCCKFVDDRFMYFVIVISGLFSFLIMRKLLKNKISNSMRLFILEVYPHVFLCLSLLLFWWYLSINWSLRF